MNHFSFEQWLKSNHCNKFNVCLPSFPGGAGDVWFSLKGTTYQNNSVITLEDVGEGDDALRCITDYPNCCRYPFTGPRVIGNWFFPNGTRVVSSDARWDFHRTRWQSVVRLHRRRGGAEGLYCCKIPNTLNITQSIYIGVYSKSNGKPSLTSMVTMQVDVLLTNNSKLSCKQVINSYIVYTYIFAAGEGWYIYNS